MDDLIAAGEVSLDKHQRGEITNEEARAHHQKVRDAMVDYTSTLEGAAAFRADLAAAEACAATGDAIAANQDTRRIIDEGAIRAQTNREIENAYRATQGKPPLRTALPQTFAQEAEAKRAAEQAAAEKAAKKADPFGLRAERNTQQRIEEQAESHRDPRSERHVAALDHYLAHPDSPNPVTLNEGDRQHIFENAGQNRHAAILTLIGHNFTSALGENDLEHFDSRDSYVDTAYQLLRRTPPGELSSAERFAVFCEIVDGEDHGRYDDIARSYANWEAQHDPQRLNDYNAYYDWDNYLKKPENIDTTAV